MRALVGGGVSVVVAAEKDAPVMHSRLPQSRIAMPSPSSDPEGALAAIMRLGRSIMQEYGKRPLLVYGSDPDLAFVYRHRTTLSTAFSLLLNEPVVASALLNKDRFYAYATARGVSVPRTVGVGDNPPTLDELVPPIIVKPISKHGDKEPWRRDMFGDAKARTFRSHDELRQLRGFERHRDALVVQECVHGPVTDLVSFHGFSDEHANVLAAFCGRKLRTYPSTGGESALIELVVDPDLMKLGKSVARKLGLLGVYKIDLIRDARSGSFAVLEVNARFNLWHQLGTAHGVSIPAVAHDYLVHGIRRFTSAYRPRARWGNMYRNLQSYRNGDLPLVALTRSLLEAPTVYETLSWSDPAPALWWLREMAYARAGTWRATA